MQILRVRVRQAYGLPTSSLISTLTPIFFISKNFSRLIHFIYLVTLTQSLSAFFPVSSVSFLDLQHHLHEEWHTSATQYTRNHLSFSVLNLTPASFDDTLLLALNEDPANSPRLLTSMSLSIPV